jgi:hypothetical protein
MVPHDVVLSKLDAGRQKDLEFASAAAALVLVDRSELLARLPLVSTTQDHSRAIKARISALYSQAGSPISESQTK